MFCPCDQLEHLKLLETEDVLIDWTHPIYLNFTHANIMAKIEEFYESIGAIEKQYGDIYVKTNVDEEDDGASV